MTSRSDLLSMAGGLVNGERAEQYGSPVDNFGRIAALWSTYLRTPISAGDVAAMMVLMKAARLSWNPVHLDSLVDIAGYAACGAEVSGA